MPADASQPNIGYGNHVQMVALNTFGRIAVNAKYLTIE